MRRIVAVLGTLVLAVALAGALAPTASAETRSWSTHNGVVQKVKVAFGTDRVVLSMAARAPRNGSFSEGHWLLDTSAAEGAEFEITWSLGLEPSFENAGGTPVTCPGIDRRVGSTTVRFAVPASCLADAEGTEPTWVSSRIRASVEGTGPGGDFVRRHGSFPRSGAFTAPVHRETTAG